MKNISRRLYISTLLANSIEPPHQGFNEKDTINSYNKWATKLLQMADHLIQKEQEIEKTFSSDKIK